MPNDQSTQYDTGKITPPKVVHFSFPPDRHYLNTFKSVSMCFYNRLLPIISLQGFSGVMGTLQAGHWLLFFNHKSIQTEQNTWLLMHMTGWRTFEKETLLLVQGNSHNQNLNRFSLEQTNRCSRVQQQVL